MANLNPRQYHNKKRNKKVMNNLNRMSWDEKETSGGENNFDTTQKRMIDR